METRIIESEHGNFYARVYASGLCHICESNDNEYLGAVSEDVVEEVLRILENYHRELTI